MLYLYAVSILINGFYFKIRFSLSSFIGDAKYLKYFSTKSVEN